jgi:hypothetical protein
LNGTNVLISWPAGTPGYALQQNTNLTTTNWVNVTNPAVPNQGMNQITALPNGSGLFYRLALPAP